MAETPNRHHLVTVRMGAHNSPKEMVLMLMLNSPYYALSEALID